MQYSNAVSEAEVLDFEGGWVSMRWRYCRWRGGWSLVLLLLRWCCGSLGRLRLLEKERAETLGIRLGDEAALCCRGRQDCGIPQIGQLGWTAGGAEDLQLLAGLNRAVVSIELYGDMTTCTWCILARGISWRTNWRIWVRHSRSSPPTLKQDMVCPSKDVSCKLK